MVPIRRFGLCYLPSANTHRLFCLDAEIAFPFLDAFEFVFAKRADFLIRDFFDFFFDDFVADEACHRRSIVHEVFLERHESIGMTAIQNLIIFT